MKNHYQHIVVLTGAGISAESGIKTFRDSNGLWENHVIEDVASPEGFLRDPELVYRFYNKRRAQLVKGAKDRVHPNTAHKALATLEEKTDAKFTLITQNVDDLHERAGSKEVLHMHGSLMKMRCQACGRSSAALKNFDQRDLCPQCQALGQLRPDIVWFGEMPFHLERAANELSECDLFLCIGTSGLVYPAAQFVSLTKAACHRVELNLEETQLSPLFEQVICAPASLSLPKYVDELLK